MIRPIGPAPQYTIVQRLWAGKAHVMRTLDKLRVEGRCGFTVYLAPGPHGANTAMPSELPGGPTTVEIAAVARKVGISDTGMLLCWDADRILALVPPFPIPQSSATQGSYFEQIWEIMETRPDIGIVLCRLGRYAVGVLNGDRLVVSKSDTRYVKSRHRAGGSSQRRFERSRERLIHELFQATCEAASSVLSPYERRLDHLILGGEKHTLRRLVQNCTLLQRLKPITLQRVLDVPRPSHKALENIHREVWKSRIVSLARVYP